MKNKIFWQSKTTEEINGYITKLFLDPTVSMENKIKKVLKIFKALLSLLNEEQLSRLLELLQECEKNNKILLDTQNHQTIGAFNS
jgi:3-deoxy-D-arabino-heptulosonate 7-phosphate (DAHP) synthase